MLMFYILSAMHYHDLIKYRSALFILILWPSWILAQGGAPDPIHIELVRPNFITISNDLHKNNRIGYRFHEHEPITYGEVPLSERAADINQE